MASSQSGKQKASVAVSVMHRNPSGQPPVETYVSAGSHSRRQSPLSPPSAKQAVPASQVMVASQRPPSSPSSAAPGTGPLQPRVEAASSTDAAQSSPPTPPLPGPAPPGSPWPPALPSPAWPPVAPVTPPVAASLSPPSPPRALPPVAVAPPVLPPPVPPVVRPPVPPPLAPPASSAPPSPARPGTESLPASSSFLQATNREIRARPKTRRVRVIEALIVVMARRSSTPENVRGGPLSTERLGGGDAEPGSPSDGTPGCGTDRRAARPGRCALGVGDESR